MFCMEKLNVVTGHASGEITEKKSRFIANVFEVHSEEEALLFLESIRKQYYDAKHNCFAFVVGEKNELQRFSDDKEPQGTAGKPILEVIKGQGYHNTLIVVTRYFGGVLLGTGGLVRAYTQAAQEGLCQAEQTGCASPVALGQRLSIICDYNLSGKIQYIISQAELPLEDTIYGADVTYKLIVPQDSVSMITKKITEASNASALIEYGDKLAFSMSGTKPLPYYF